MNDTNHLESYINNMNFCLNKSNSFRPCSHDNKVNYTISKKKGAMLQLNKKLSKKSVSPPRFFSSQCSGGHALINIYDDSSRLFYD